MGAIAEWRAHLLLDALGEGQISLEGFEHEVHRQARLREQLVVDANARLS